MTKVTTAGLKPLACSPEMTHSLEYARRLAKKIKKQKQIPHHEALREVAREMGFSGWLEFVKHHADAGLGRKQQ
jgi:hypothetical protein